MVVGQVHRGLGQAGAGAPHLVRRVRAGAGVEPGELYLGLELSSDGRPHPAASPGAEGQLAELGQQLAGRGGADLLPPELLHLPHDGEEGGDGLQAEARHPVQQVLEGARPHTGRLQAAAQAVDSDLLPVPAAQPGQVDDLGVEELV